MGRTEAIADSGCTSPGGEGGTETPRLLELNEERGEARGETYGRVSQAPGSHEELSKIQRDGEGIRSLNRAGQAVT